jgi:hypothetical protein
MKNDDPIPAHTDESFRIENIYMDDLLTEVRALPYQYDDMIYDKKRLVCFYLASYTFNSMVIIISFQLLF